MSVTTLEKTREFEFNDRHFSILRKLVSEHTGIVLSDAKKELVYGRLSRRLRKLGLNSFDVYCDLLEKTDNDDEFVNFVNAVTTNLTSFFRENHHFEFLSQTVIPWLLRENASSRRIRIWSAGCSTGEEPYSVAMVLRESIPDIDNWDVRLLATDIDSSVLETASQGVYTEERINGLSKQRARRWFRRGTGEQQGNVKVSRELQNLITFKQLNLMHPLPMRGPFDIIFCRNVVIYFDKPTQRVLFDKYANIMRHDGYLFIGHSENLFQVSDRFEALGQTMYRRKR